MNQKGVTLIEMVLSIVILSLIAYVVTDAFVYSSRSVLTGNQARDATQEGRIAVDRMIREIRNIRDKKCVVVASDSRFSFIDENNNTIDFNWAGAQGTPLTRAENGVPNTLVGGVDNVLPGSPLFKYYDSTDVKPRNVIANPCAGPGTCAAACGSTNPTPIWSVSVDLIAKSGSESMEFRSEVHPVNF